MSLCFGVRTVTSNENATANAIVMDLEGAGTNPDFQIIL